MRLTRPAALLTIILLLLSHSRPAHSFPDWAWKQTGYSLVVVGAVLLGAAVHFFRRERSAHRLQLEEEQCQADEHRRNFEHDRRAEEDGYEMANLGPASPVYRTDGGAAPYSSRPAAIVRPSNAVLPQEALRDNFRNVIGLRGEHRVRGGGVAEFGVFRPPPSARTTG